MIRRAGTIFQTILWRMRHHSARHFAIVSDESLASGTLTPYTASFVNQVRKWDMSLHFAAQSLQSLDVRVAQSLLDQFARIVCFKISGKTAEQLARLIAVCQLRDDAVWYREARESQRVVGHETVETQSARTGQPLPGTTRRPIDYTTGTRDRTLYGTHVEVSEHRKPPLHQIFDIEKALVTQAPGNFTWFARGTMGHGYMPLVPVRNVNADELLNTEYHQGRRRVSGTDGTEAHLPRVRR